MASRCCGAEASSRLVQEAFLARLSAEFCTVLPVSKTPAVEHPKPLQGPGLQARTESRHLREETARESIVVAPTQQLLSPTAVVDI